MHAHIIDLTSQCRAAKAFPTSPLPSITTTCYPNGTDEPGIVLRGTGYAQRCAAQIIHHNIPDALWALEVLNRYGHLVTHPADREPAR